MATPTQKHRNVALSTPLGDDMLVVRSVSVVEQLGRLFRIEAELYGTTDVKFDAIVGQNATFRVEMGQGRTRYFNGIVSRFVQTRVEGRHTRYQATFVPWLWFLTRTADCRIFQQKSTPDILGEVFKGHGFSDFRLALSGSYPKWEYCVQYRETDFNFVSRLMEQAGIYYFFEHENGKHTLVLADAEAAHKPMPGYGQQIYRPVQEQKTPGEYMDDWVMEKNLVPGLYAHTDFDFENPKKSLRTNSAIVPAHAQASFEIFDYPGEFKTSAEGEATARVRIEELHADHEIFRGHSNARGLAVGATFTLAEHPRPDLNRGYLVTTASYHITGDDAEAGGGGSGGEFFSANLTAIDATRPFRPARITPKPIVQGLQTAMVVGPSGEEIHTDKYGRVKVQFFWDRYGKANENSSCWIRVSQGWAGKKWGAIYIPRIGQEVIVEFLEGDPDRPIITGRVYNGDAMPPYDLPAEKTKSTLKSNTTKGGNGFNEIRFEDKKGQEQIFVHGQRDLDVRIRDDIRETNYGHREIRVGWEKDGQTGGNLNTLVRKDVNTHVKGGQFEEVEKQLNQTVKEDVVEDYQKNQSTFVKETLQLNAKEIVIEGATAIHEKSGKISIEGAQSVHIKGATVAIEGSSAVSLKVGGNFVSVSPAGVAIKGSLVLINSGGAGSSAQSPKAAVAAEIRAPLEPRPADTGKTGEIAKTSTSPITAVKRVLTSQKAPPYVPLPPSKMAISAPLPAAIAGKIQRRQERLDLVGRGQQPGASQAARAAAARLEQNIDGVEKAQLSKDSYHWVRDETCPPGWSRGSDNPEELRRKYGIDLESLAPSDGAFRAEIYEPDPAVFGPEAKPVLVFKGTSEGADWTGANIPQGVGFETEYYNRAMGLAKKLDRKGVDYDIAGHSLGGGLASAASATSSKIRNTTTFNAAGLNSKTIDRRGAELADASHTQAYRVDGEILTYVQEQAPVLNRLMPDAVGERHELAAVDRPAMDGMSLRGKIDERVERHDMAVVIQGIEKQKAEDQATLSNQ